MREATPALWAPDIQDLGDRIATLSLREVAAVSAYLREVHKIEPGPRRQEFVPPPPPPPPKPTAFTVRLDGFDSTRKIQLIRLVQGLAGLGLKEAKDRIEGVPWAVAEKLPTAEAEALQARLAEAGGRVTLTA